MIAVFLCAQAVFLAQLAANAFTAAGAMPVSERAGPCAVGTVLTWAALACAWGAGR